MYIYVSVYAILLAATAIAEGEVIIQEALSQADNPHHSEVTCTAGWLYICLKDNYRFRSAT